MKLDFCRWAQCFLYLPFDNTGPYGPFKRAAQGVSLFLQEVAASASDWYVAKSTSNLAEKLVIILNIFMYSVTAKR